MHDFILKEIFDTNIDKQLQNIGFDRTYTDVASKKFCYKNIKIFDLTVAQANILKQTALSVGADCATHRDTITAQIEKTDCILGGSVAQLEVIAHKLTKQPFGLKNLGEMLKEFIDKKEVNQTKIVGILNLTKDSFSDGGEFWEVDNAIKHFDEMINAGADVIELGAESTRPNFEDVDCDKQLEKLLPILNYYNDKTVEISIDTRSSKVARECLKLGANIINDVSGLKHDDKMAQTVAEFDAKIVIQDFENGEIDDIYMNLRNQALYAISQGIKSENIIIDPGIGFGKTREQNFEIIKNIGEFKSLGYPVMLGISRKSLLDMSDKDNLTKDIFTVALNTLAVNKNVDYIRVHNVDLHKSMLKLFSI